MKTQMTNPLNWPLPILLCFLAFRATLSIRPGFEVLIWPYSVTIALSSLATMLQIVLLNSDEDNEPTPPAVDLFLSYTAWASLSFLGGVLTELGLRGARYLLYATIGTLVLAAILIHIIQPKLILTLIRILMTPIGIVRQMIQSFVLWCKGSV